jgi:hypothetical protein
MPQKAFKPSDQVLYVPDHVKDQIDPDNLAAALDIPDVEAGFVTGPAGEGSYFCRYWRKDNPGELRTTANSEATSGRDLVAYQIMPWTKIRMVMKRLGYIDK